MPTADDDGGFQENPCIATLNALAERLAVLRKEDAT